MLLRILRGIAVVAILTAGATGAARAALVDAIEYYNANLDHYFYTAYPDEINALDSGALTGWQRTGLSFKVFNAPSPGSVPVCRFYGLPGAGLDSHFITANADECNLLMQPPYNSAWLLESADAFEVFLPNFATGQCPPGSVPVYRAWDHRPDSDHRYTPDPAVELAMIAIGYVAEGYGTSATPTSMCSPTSMPSGGAPVCAPTASDVAPYVGTTITVVAQCSGSPTSYAWSGCTSMSGRCMATASVNGPQTYTVVATNSSGASVPASVSVNWQKLPPPPVCSLVVTANSDLPVVGSLVLLTAVCSNTPSSYAWGGCASGTNNCSTSAANPGVQTYSVSAANPGGMGAPAFASVNWQASAAAPPGFCGQFPSYLFTDDGWVGARLISRDFTDAPGFAWNGVWVVKLTVPGDATTGSLGAVTVAEFGGPPTPRQMTISRFPCDFRPDDPTGNNGPLAEADSNTTRLEFVLGAGSDGLPGLTPGQAYYVNVRNWQPLTGSISCDPSIGRCDAFMDVTVPR
jgi:hypothetical protein